MAELGEETLRQCSEHAGLAHYQAALLLATGAPGVNAHLHYYSVPIQVAQMVSRLLAGGQDLRGGDPRTEQPATSRTACVPCLVAGGVVAETLSHVVCKCELYKEVRREAAISDILLSGGNIYFHRQERWTWSTAAVLHKHYGDQKAIRQREKYPQQERLAKLCR